VDAPHSWQQYAHRAGRAGRMGARGGVVTIVAPGERRVLGAAAARLGLELREAKAGRGVD
jgi:superfamily II DNA/RNA helicase